MKIFQKLEYGTIIPKRKKLKFKFFFKKDFVSILKSNAIPYLKIMIESVKNF